MREGLIIDHGNDGMMRTVNDTSFEEKVSDIEKIMDNDVFSESTLERVKQESPEFYSALTANGFASTLAARVKKHEKVYGYLVCVAKRSLRIWQENECALIYYLTCILAESI